MIVWTTSLYASNVMPYHGMGYFWNGLTRYTAPVPAIGETKIRLGGVGSQFMGPAGTLTL